MPPLSTRARDGVVIAVLALIAVSGAGLATALDHLPGDATRPELTVRGDALIAPRFASLGAALGSVDAEVVAVADAARRVLRGLYALDESAVREALQAGDAAVAARDAAARELALSRSRLLDGIDVARLSQVNRARITHLDAAIAAMSEMPPAWADAAQAAVAAVRLLDALRGHDGLVFKATEHGRGERFGAALDALDRAREALTEARAIRAGLAGTVDVTTLDGWLERAGDYDTALRRLYALLRDSGGAVTDEVRAANEAVERAQAALPRDEGALVVIVSDVAGARVTASVVTIERARGSVAQAVTALD